MQVKQKNEIYLLIHFYLYFDCQRWQGVKRNQSHIGFTNLHMSVVINMPIMLQWAFKGRLTLLQSALNYY